MWRPGKVPIQYQFTHTWRPSLFPYYTYQFACVFTAEYWMVQVPVDALVPARDALVALANQLLQQLPQVVLVSVSVSISYTNPTKYRVREHHKRRIA
jgi:hypothetical protein